MPKEKKQLDILEHFLEDDQSIFLKNIKKDDQKEDWTQGFYSPQAKETSEIIKEEDEGQLAVDVYQKEDKIIVLAVIGGVDPGKLDISLHNDILTIRGERQRQAQVEEENYFYKECYWGKFSRSIILPVEVKSEAITASIKNGILKIILPKASPKKKIQVKVIDEE